MNISITPMKVDDLPDVMGLEQECFSTPWSLEAFVDELERGFSHFLVARDDDGTLLGFVCFWALVDEAHILNIAVRADARRRGVGKALALETLRAAYRLGARTATLEVRERNEAALGLYGGLGFARVGLRRGYYEKPSDNAVIMWLYDIARLLEKSP